MDSRQFIDYRSNADDVFGSRNAGVFLWVDFRKYLSALDLADLSIRSESSHLDVYRRREAKIGALCLKNGVSIGLGTRFFTEELGWFRVTFTASREALIEGLARILRSLEEMESSGWAE